ncbi:MAG: hypothetical protein AB7F66_08360 [Bacteriovoracia bacterium]
MKMNLLKKASFCLIAAGMAANLVSCGSSGTPATPLIAPQNPFNPYNAPGSWGYQNCQQFSGYRECRINVFYNTYLSSNGGTNMKLNPNVPTGGLNVGAPLKAGDKVVVNAQGGWEEIEASSGFYWHWGACDEIDVNGFDGGTLTTYQGQPRGLMISNGTTAQFVGGSNQVQIASDGQLRVGLNMNGPSSGDFLCAGVGFTELYIRHCEDGSNNTVVCP